MESMLLGAGGVFEEAIAEAALLLCGDCKIVETVRGSGAAVDAAFWAGRLSREVAYSVQVEGLRQLHSCDHVKHGTATWRLLAKCFIWSSKCAHRAVTLVNWFLTASRSQSAHFGRQL